MIELKKNKIYICISNAKKGGFFSWLQRFVTGIDITHSEPILHKDFYGQVGLSAEHSCTLEYIQRLIDNEDIDVWIYEIDIGNLDAEVIEKYLVNKYIGKGYGYLQCLNAIIIRIAEIIGIDARRWVLFKSGLWCSEICYQLFELCSNKLNQEFVFELHKWKPDNFNSGDLYNLMEKYFKNNLIFKK